jgi:uncharacterized membrane protein YebE (DUF533 family)
MHQEKPQESEQMMDTIQQAKNKASELVLLYPNAKTVRELINTAQADGHFKDETEMLSVWGRVCRLLPQE